MIRRAQRWANRVSSFCPPPLALDSDPRKRVLLVHAHPCPDSFSHALADAVEDGLLSGRHEIHRIDLHRFEPPSAAGRSLRGGRFEPRLGDDERRAYFSANVRECVTTMRRDPHVATLADSLADADAVVFVYPTWWMNVPAMLKGFCDRVLVRGVAWRFPSDADADGGGGGGDGDGDGGAGADAAATGLVPLLTNVRAIAGVTTYGAPRHIVAGAGDNGRRMISHAIRPVFSPECTLLWLGLYSMDDCSAEDRARHLERVRARFRYF